ncbi:MULTISPECIES: hypothetical protein [Streptosporangium]|uniref:Uncharacterized protein n=1 Tax=Streptosporangium brasiliense TaxID=47480 RepID=A0ABT9RGF3_9ACTN|nr:hypothetical protein [Streptosporangium brasiliense]MDP9868368.1 hypothetical protein [Streptosporangium brasiliense]
MPEMASWYATASGLVMVLTEVIEFGANPEGGRVRAGRVSLSSHPAGDRYLAR